MKNTKNIILMITGLLCPLAVSLADGVHRVTLHPDVEKQVILGLGFEIQSDSIGSGNNGLPEEPFAVPHDLIQSERDRLSTEMLQGFRYCRLAGGLYWRGLDPEQKYLQPRWPEQLEELRHMLELAGVEGLSFEYWSPAPFWKSTGSYIGGTLRCFDEDFANDPVYQGDKEQFLEDFAYAVVKDITTLEAAGLNISMWGLQNEPDMSNNSYPTCLYRSSEDYVMAYKAVASAVRDHDPSIMLFADTAHAFPKFIGPAMGDPEIAELVDSYVVHTIGWDSERVQEVHDNIREQLPYRPWFQNEYEYLKGGTTPERCLNTVQHIMNSFQIGENPSWFWLHALKPFGNSEASGYSLGYWKSLIEPTTSLGDAGERRRWTGGPKYSYIPPELADGDYVSVLRAKGGEAPGNRFSVIIEGDATVYLVASRILSSPPEGFDLTDLYAKYGDGNRDVIYKKTVLGGEELRFPGNTHKTTEGYEPPHALFVKSVDDSERSPDLSHARVSSEGTSTARRKRVSSQRLGRSPGVALTSQHDELTPSFEIKVGNNSPVKIRSEAIKYAEIMDEMEPGHWIYNDYNWNAVGSFAKRMPWDSVAIDLDDHTYNKDAKVFSFKRPNGKLTVVLSNRTSEPYRFLVETGIDGDSWNGYRYTPFERGPGTMGVPVGSQSEQALAVELEPLSWEFWEQQ